MLPSVTVSGSPQAKTTVSPNLSEDFPFLQDTCQTRYAHKAHRGRAFPIFVSPSYWTCLFFCYTIMSIIWLLVADVLFQNPDHLVWTAMLFISKQIFLHCLKPQETSYKRLNARFPIPSGDLAEWPSPSRSVLPGFFSPLRRSCTVVVTENGNREARWAECVCFCAEACVYVSLSKVLSWNEGWYTCHRYECISIMIC